MCLRCNWNKSQTINYIRSDESVESDMGSTRRKCGKNSNFHPHRKKNHHYILHRSTIWLKMTLTFDWFTNSMNAQMCTNIENHLPSTEMNSSCNLLTCQKPINERSLFSLATSNNSSECQFRSKKIRTFKETELLPWKMNVHKLFYFLRPFCFLLLLIPSIHLCQLENVSLAICNNIKFAVPKSVGTIVKQIYLKAKKLV